MIKDAHAYLDEHNLRQYIERAEGNGEFKADIADLCRMHNLVLTRRAFTVLEFGTGFSTLFLADAISKNAQHFYEQNPEPKYLRDDAFRVFSVDTSAKWLRLTASNTPEHLQQHVELWQSSAEVGQHQGQMCSYYSYLPDITPDFVYLDGPDPREVIGSINGLSFRSRHRSVMAADLLLMEPSMHAGLFVLVDGRVNNAAFLENNLRRQYEVIHDKRGDVSTFELVR